MLLLVMGLRVVTLRSSLAQGQKGITTTTQMADFKALKLENRLMLCGEHHTL